MRHKSNFSSIVNDFFRLWFHQDTHNEFSSVTQCINFFKAFCSPFLVNVCIIALQFVTCNPTLHLTPFLYCVTKLRFFYCRLHSVYSANSDSNATWTIYSSSYKGFPSSATSLSSSYNIVIPSSSHIAHNKVSAYVIRKWDEQMQNLCCTIWLGR